MPAWLVGDVHNANLKAVLGTHGNHIEIVKEENSSYSANIMFVAHQSRSYTGRESHEAG